MWYFAIVCIIYIVRWAINGKMPWQYNFLKNIRIIKLDEYEYEVHVRHIPFSRLTEQFDTITLKWFRWYKLKYTRPSAEGKSKLDLDLINSPFATYSTEYDANVAALVLKSNSDKPVVIKPTIVGYL